MHSIINKCIGIKHVSVYAVSLMKVNCGRHYLQVFARPLTPYLWIICLFLTKLNNSLYQHLSGILKTSVSLLPKKELLLFVFPLMFKPIHSHSIISALFWSCLLYKFEGFSHQAMFEGFSHQTYVGLKVSHIKPCCLRQIE